MCDQRDIYSDSVWNPHWNRDDQRQCRGQSPNGGPNRRGIKFRPDEFAEQRHRQGRHKRQLHTDPQPTVWTLQQSCPVELSGGACSYHLQPTTEHGDSGRKPRNSHPEHFHNGIGRAGNYLWFNASTSDLCGMDTVIGWLNRTTSDRFQCSLKTAPRDHAVGSGEWDFDLHGRMRGRNRNHFAPTHWNHSGDLHYHGYGNFGGFEALNPCNSYRPMKVRKRRFRLSCMSPCFGRRLAGS